jgi:hypothetical protein
MSVEPLTIQPATTKVLGGKPKHFTFLTLLVGVHAILSFAYFKPIARMRLRHFHQWVSAPGGCFLSTVILALCLLLAKAPGGAAAATGPESLDPRLPGFIKAKEQQARALAKELELKSPAGVWKVFELYGLGEWAAATNQFERLKQHNGQYEGSKDDPTIHTPLFQTIIEVVTACEPFAFGEPKFARAFGDGIIESIPRRSIYFGGTDPGRGLVTGLCKSQIDADPFFTITQNALADSNYLVYLRQMYGKKIYIPTEEDSQKCFNEYLTDAQERLKQNKIKPGEDVRVVDNRVVVSGQVAVMQINGLLAKLIFENNTNCDFYIEESFPLEWMYPYLVPHGLILHLERRPLASLSAEIVSKDQAYWRKFCQSAIGGGLSETSTVKEVCDFARKTFHEHDFAGFTGDRKFIADDHAQKAFSKLRSSIAGLYAWRLNDVSAPVERQRMSAAADLAFRQAFALCPYSPEAVFRYVNLLTQADRLDDAMAIARTAWEIDHTNSQVKDLVDKLLDMKEAKATDVGSHEK